MMKCSMAWAGLISVDVQVVAVMAKLDYDFDLGSIRPFVGAGLGVANFAVDLKAPHSI